jgi:hypothetical protein
VIERTETKKEERKKRKRKGGKNEIIKRNKTKDQLKIIQQQHTEMKRSQEARKMTKRDFPSNFSFLLEKNNSTQASKCWLIR